MDRRRFLALCAVGSALAGCPARSRERGSSGTPDGTGGETPTVMEESSPTPTPVAPLDGSWPSYQRDAGNTGGTAASGPTDAPTERWRRATATGRPVSLAAADGVFVVVAATTRPRRSEGGSTDGAIYARDAADGSLRWVGDGSVATGAGTVVSDGTAVAFDGKALVGVGVDTGDERWSLPLEGAVVGLAAVPGRVLVATPARIVAVTPADGTRQWRHGVEGEIVTPPAAADGTVAAGLASGGVVALDADTGTRRWRVSLDGEPLEPAVGNGHVYAAVGSRLLALDGESGNRIWEEGTDQPIVAPPAALSGAVSVVTLDDAADGSRAPQSGEGTPTPTAADVRWFEGTVTSFGATDGTVRWQVARTERYSFTSGPPEELALTVAGELVLVDFAGTLVAYETADGEQAWATEAGSVRPAVTDGVVSTGTVGLALETGSRRWRLRIGDSVISAPAVVGNTLYVGSDDNYLYALAANSGQIDWAARTDDIIRAAPVVGADAVYVGTIDGTLYGFDRADGTKLWSTALGGQIRSPALEDGTLYLGNFSETVRAIDTADGTEIWGTQVDSDRFVALEVALADGAVYAGANGDLRAFETSDGTERWSVLVGNRSRVQSPPVATNGRVFVNVGQALRAYDTADGSVEWSVPIAGNANEPPVVHDGVVYTSDDSAVHAVDAADGTVRWERSVGNALAMVATDSAIYGWGHDTPLLALDPADGSPLWRDHSFEPRSPLAVADGHLFVGDDSGFVRALGPRD